MILDVHDPWDRDDVVLIHQEVRHAPTSGETARNGEEIAQLESLGHLVHDRVDHIGVRQALKGVELRVPAGMGRGLEDDRVEGRMREAEPQDVGKLIVVDPFLDGRHQRHR